VPVFKPSKELRALVAEEEPASSSDQSHQSEAASGL
jgi:hypothetical protein